MIGGQGEAAACTLGGMADKQGFYWDHDECAWVRCPAPQQTVEVPEQAVPQSRGVESTPESDVRSAVKAGNNVQAADLPCQLQRLT